MKSEWKVVHYGQRRKFAQHQQDMQSRNPRWGKESPPAPYKWMRNFQLPNQNYSNPNHSLQNRSKHKLCVHWRARKHTNINETTRIQDKSIGKNDMKWLYMWDKHKLIWSAMAECG